ncbi:MAG: hypothetical protein K6E58_01515 [Eubacterium sp.]|nr:hypothetical protein [Eubacterium sp.]
MRLSKFSKKWIACFCAIAMVVSSIVFTPSSDVKAAKPETVDGITYTVTDGAQGDWTGIETQGIIDKARIHFAWGKQVDESSIAVKVDGKDVTVGGTNPYGVYITIADVNAAVNNELGEYTIQITAVSTDSEQLMWTADLKMEEAAPTTTRDPSVFEWVDIVNSDGLQYDDRTPTRVDTFQNPGWPDQKEAGVYVLQPESAGAPLKVTIDGVEVTTGDNGDYGTFYQMGAGLLFYGSTFSNEITNIVVNYAGEYGDATLVIKNTKVAPTEETTEETTEAPTEETTEAPTEETTEAPTEETTEAPTEDDYTYTNDSWINGGYEEGIYAVYAGIWESGQRAIVGAKFDSSSPNSLPVNVKENTKDGDWLVQLKFKATGLEEGKTYAFNITAGDAIVFNRVVTVEGDAYGDTIDVHSTIPDGESVLVLTATETEPVTTEEPTTDPEGYSLVAAPGSDGSVKPGDWDIYQGGTWANALVGYKDANADAIKIKVYSSNGNAGCWGIQAKYKITGLNPSETYEFVADYDASAAGTMFIKLENIDDGVTTSAIAGSNQYKKTITGVSGVTMVMELSGFAADTVIDVKSVKATSTTPTTEAPTTEEPTTEAPTTETPTTEAPTTAKPTAAPTTTKSSEVSTTTKTAKPGRATVKKAVKKKKSAKKIKVTLKKVKGAVGYQVAVYKSKKNAKKNKKALVKKYYKKLKFTVKSKKFKNKKTLWVKARAFALNGNAKKFGTWSKPKKTKKK